LQTLKRFVHKQQLVLGIAARGLRLVQRHRLLADAALLSITRARRIDQDAAHQSGRNGEEVLAILPLDLFQLEQT